jgi:hypothetical protein
MVGASEHAPVIQQLSGAGPAKEPADDHLATLPRTSAGSLCSKIRPRTQACHRDVEEQTLRAGTGAAIRRFAHSPMTTENNECFGECGAYRL